MKSEKIELRTPSLKLNEEIKVEIIIKTKIKGKNISINEQNKDKIISSLKTITYSDYLTIKEPLKSFLNKHNIFPIEKATLNKKENIAIIHSLNLPKNIKISVVKYFYLQRNENIIAQIDEYESILNINLKNGDRIIITDDKKLKVLLDNEIGKKEKSKIFNKIYEINNDLNSVDKNKIKEIINYIIKTKKKYILIYISVLLFLIIFIIIGIGIYLYIKYKKNNKKKIEFKDEELIVNIKYLSNFIYRYNFTKTIKIKVKSNSVSEENSTNEIEQISNFIFLIKNKYIEDNSTIYIRKYWYRGYLGILSLDIYNKTGNIPIIYDKKLNELIKKKHIIHNNNNQLVDNITFVIIDFDENGNIKDY